MKILFLDVDGVLNNLEVLSSSRSSDPLGESHLKLLKTLVAGAGCEIVLSSTWRLFKESRDNLKFAFMEHNIPLWIGCTPDLRNVPRSTEILQWLRDNTNVPVVAAGLDDDKDIDIGTKHGMPVQFKPFFTTFQHGLTAETVQKVVDWFNINTLR